MLKWLNENVPWGAFVLLAIIGGAVAHIRVYEQAKDGVWQEAPGPSS
jgi:hypothetical protein